MSWRRLLADLEAQAESESELVLAAEVADRTRRERASIELVDRWTAAIGSDITVELVGGNRHAGQLADVGPDWLLLIDPHAPDREQVIATGAVVATRFVGAWAVPSTLSTAQRGQDLAWLVRRIASDRSTVRISTAAGCFTGTIDRVGADHLDLAVHDADVLRRSAEVRERALIAIRAIAVIERC